MPRTDFDGDGHDDILWRNTQTGVVTSWLGDEGGSFINNDAAGADPYAIGELWGIGDFNADGRSDTLWRNDRGEVFLASTYPDGAFYFIWSMGFVKTVPLDWRIAGTGDFNGDGRDDILWRSDGGIVTDWLSQPQQSPFANNHANTGQVVPSDWHIVGTGDFNGDGRDDILWRSDGGIVTNWLGQENGGFLNNHVNTGQVIPLSWQIVGTGDFNGDGHDDVLWRAADGTLVDWLGQENGGFLNNHINTGEVVASSWRVIGTGDYDGDGRDDILWRNDDGTVTNWLGQDDGGFEDNSAHADYSVAAVWQSQPNPAGYGYWDY